MDEIKLGETAMNEATPENENMPVLLVDAEPRTQAMEPLAAEEEVVLDETKKTPVALGEITEMRDTNRKVFRMSDGSQQAVFYPEPVHVQNAETGNFEDVDNTLAVEADGKHFCNRKNHFTARFNNEEESDELFCVENGKYAVTVLSKTKKQQAALHQKPLLVPDAQDLPAMEKHDKLVFENAIGGADLEYNVTGNGVKENIIIKEKQDLYRYAFVLQFKNVVPKHLEDERKIVFTATDSDATIFTIPAPFMTDANGVDSTAVFYELKEAQDGVLHLAVVADADWLNAEERAFPVTIDPQIQMEHGYALSTYSWDNGYLYSASQHTVGTTGSGDGYCNAYRMYIDLSLPTLPRNARIKKAELQLKQHSITADCCSTARLGLYRANTDYYSPDCVTYPDSDLIDFEPLKCNCDTYSFDITTLLDRYYAEEIDKANLVVKMIDEYCSCFNQVTLYGSAYYDYAPTLCITYDSNYGVNTSGRTHTHTIGRFGQGSIDLQTGNLMFEAEGFSWGGNRMPVTLRHLYNSALSNYKYTKNASIKLDAADFSAMNLGHGWKLNLMQSMTSATNREDGVVYVYVDENGAETFFKQSSKCSCGEECHSTSCYKLYEDVDGAEMYYDNQKRTLTIGDEVRLFDASGRLIRVTDAHDNHMDITYTAGRITSVTDGAGREFVFSYNAAGFLSAIIAPDGSKMLYEYTGNLLTAITYPDGTKAVLNYGSAYSAPSIITLTDAKDVAQYQVEYTFTGDRVSAVTEKGMENGEQVLGAKSAYSYSAASGRTVITTTEPADDNGEVMTYKTVYTFDDDGNIVSQYMYTKETGNVGLNGTEEEKETAASGINPYAGENGTGVVSNINNLLKAHNFNSLSYWTKAGTYLSAYSSSNEAYAKFGKYYLHMQSTNENAENHGVYQTTINLPKGNYTFSAYVKTTDAITGANAPGVYLRVTDTAGNVLGETEHLPTADFTRLILPFELTASKQLRVYVLMNGCGTAYISNAQLENNAAANAYNMLINGNMELSSLGWSRIGSAYETTGACFNMSKSLMMYGDLNTTCYAYQTVYPKTAVGTRETFTLSGWAKGYGIVKREREGLPAPTFRLRAVIQYTDYTTETHVAEFSPCTEEWQLASVQFSKEKYLGIRQIQVFCDYDYNFGTAYFDDIQLVRDAVETGLTADAFVTEAADDTTAETENTAPVFEESVDAFGNALTETTFTDGEFGTIYRSFAYDADGNDLIGETDARGAKTVHTVNEDTSRTEETTDRLGNKTAYEYDANGQTTKVTSKDAEGNEVAHVCYGYDTFHNLTEIVRGDGMKYALKYNAFHNLESINVVGETSPSTTLEHPLVTYGYKNGNSRLKSVTYANGDTMQATYNAQGQMIAEKWHNMSNELVSWYKYLYDGAGNLVCSLDILAKKEYNYTYEEGQITLANECDVTLNGEIVTGKTLVNSIRYTYDSNGQLTKKTVIPASGEAQTVYYENSEDANTVVKFTAGGRTVVSQSKNDSFGRKVFDELQLGTGFVSRQFSYHAGEVTDEHVNGEKLRSTPTTQLVSEIILSDGRTLHYDYDAEERITKVVDCMDGVSTTYAYTYDAQGQLLTETKDGAVINEMTYDAYGNILTKNGKTYAYRHEIWKDLLTAYDGQSILYDDQGNPVSYMGHTLTWEKGRQLKSFDGITYTYNGNGIRTSKTVDGVKHTYTLDGTKILREEWGGNTLIPLYDNEDTVCGIIYNDIPYYFYKNLQGDIIAIANQNGNVVAKYEYDAWGACTVTEDTSDCNISSINPYRYRGYYFDNEIGLYYLQSRYYDSNTGRFVNGDMPEIINNINESLLLNLFVYCYNNTINYQDFWGYLGLEIAAGVTIPFGTAVALIALTVFAFAYFFDKKFRDAVNQLIVMLVQRIIDGIGYLANVIYDIVSKAKRARKYSGNEVHHIVAQSDYRAASTRSFIRNYGIYPWDSYNLVTIKKTLHKHLHTNAYHAAVEIVLRSCAYRKRTYSDKKYAIIAGLVFIGALLKAASNLF